MYPAKLKSENSMLLTQPAFQFRMHFNYLSIQMMDGWIRNFTVAKTVSMLSANNH